VSQKEILMSSTRHFNVDDRVEFDLTGEPKYQGTGTVLGLSMDHIVQMYIVLLDRPIEGEKAIVVPHTLMTKLTGIDARWTGKEEFVQSK
jgi:hypothetical protein